MRSIRKTLSLILALTLVLAMPVKALADTYDISYGDITVTAVDDRQEVSYYDAASTQQTNPNDAAPVITGSTTEHTLTLESSGSATVQVTLQDVTIQSADKADTPIEVKGDSSAVITLAGNNTVSSAAGSGNAAVHVAEGSLTITGGAEDSLTATTESSGSSALNSGAAIGTNDYESLEGSITIAGGSITATGGGGGAGIGTGTCSAIADSGSINITGGSITATGGKEAAGIGGGQDNNMFGTIAISGGSVTAQGGENGSGIGAAGVREYGSIQITGGNVTAVGGQDAAGIGVGNPGGYVNYDDEILIGGDAQVTVQAGTGKEGTPQAIGLASKGSKDPPDSVRIADNAQVTVCNGGEIINTAVIDPTAQVTVTDKTWQELLPDTSVPSSPSATPTAAAETAEEASAASYWDILAWKISLAPKGSEYTIDLGSRTWIARHVLEAAIRRDITLILQWDGGEDIRLAPDADIDLTQWQVPLANLAS